MTKLYKARLIIPSFTAARGNDLFKHVEAIDNGELLIQAGRITAIGKHLKRPAGCAIHDLGDATILPPLANCHTHLQLSWLSGRTLWKKGFVPWLKSLVALIIGSGFGTEQSIALELAFHKLTASGTWLIGDIGGSIPDSISQIAALAQNHEIEISHFCEHIGFKNVDDSPWPVRCRGDLASNRGLTAMPAGHALYSTAPEILRKAHIWCKSHNRKFTFHLAESVEETELLTSGSGALADFYKDSLFPHDWQPPRMAPLPYALKLGLLGPETLAVHGVTLNSQELRDFAESGAFLCLCARSNENLGVGTSPVREAIRAGVRLCLGTDGLTSCPDLDLRNEIKYISEHMDIPLPALWRMATANACAALGYPPWAASLLPGRPARFCIWDYSENSNL